MFVYSLHLKLLCLVLRIGSTDIDDGGNKRVCEFNTSEDTPRTSQDHPSTEILKHFFFLATISGMEARGQRPTD